MKPGIYKIKTSDLRNSVAFAWGDGLDGANSHNTIIIMSGGLYYLDLAIARSSAIAVGTLIAEFDLFKNIQVNMNDTDKANLQATTFIGCQTHQPNSGTSLIHTQARMNYKGQLYLSDSLAAGTGILLQGVISTAGRW